MARARASAPAVLLRDGRVLVVGGGNEIDAAAELWDPATDGWSPTAPLNKARADFALIRLADGRALVVGGRNEDGTSFSSTYAYDPSAGMWARMGVLGTARTAPAAAALPDGRALVAGGWYHETTSSVGGIVLAAWPGDDDDASAAPDDVEPEPQGPGMATAEVMDPRTGDWSKTDAMRYARFGAASATLADGRVLVVGSLDGPSWGVTVPDGAYASAEVFDPEADRFSEAGRLPQIDRPRLEALGEPGANPIDEGEPPVSSVGTLVPLEDGGAVLIGHAQSWKHVGDITRSFRWDPTTGEWSDIGPTYIYIGEPTSKVLFAPGVPNLVGSAAAPLPDGPVLVAGGDGPAVPSGQGFSSDHTAAAWHVDAGTDSWSELPAMPAPRTQATAVALDDGSVLVIGGFGEDTPDGSSELATAVRFLPGR
jgi:hypothetical protein